MSDPAVPITSLASYHKLSQPPDGIRAEVASRLAHAILDAATIPRGAVRSPLEIDPAMTPGDSNVVTVHRTYAVANMPPDPAVAFRPKGGSARANSITSSGTIFVEYTFPHSRGDLLYTLEPQPMATSCGSTRR